MSSTQIILLERVEKLGNMGDVVAVKPGYARNYLLPQKKALRASKENIAFFEAQKKVLEAENEKKRKEAEKLAAKIKGATVSLIRQASESGQLFGSVNSRDIAIAVTEQTKEAITRAQVDLNQNIKTIGLMDVQIQLHAEVKTSVTLNIARSPEEAQIQADTGRALIDSGRDDDDEDDFVEEETVAEDAAAEDDSVESEDEAA